MSDKRYKNVCCVNCGERGHVIKDCLAPITSFGIIAFKLCRDNENDYTTDIKIKIPKEVCGNNSKKIKFLMIQRKDSMGYIDLIRGKYTDETCDHLINIFINETTVDEKNNLINKTFDELWDELWINKNSRMYKNEYQAAKVKFNKLDIKKIVNESKITYEFTEFSFPKGRKNLLEQNIQCAEREFYEETRYCRYKYNFIYGYAPIIEEFIGTNNIKYKHVYYLVKMNDDIHKPKLDTSNILQMGEVKSIGWYTYDECMYLIRPYDVAKKEMITKVYNDIINMNGNYKYSVNIPFYKKAFDFKSNSV